MTLQEEEFAEEIRQMLDERFGDEFEFGPIVVRTELDDDMLFFRTYIVFDGDVNKLDPAKTSLGPCGRTRTPRRPPAFVRFEIGVAR